MAKPLRCDPESVLADWKSGKFTERTLARKHGVSPSTIHKLVAGVDKTLDALASRRVLIDQQVADLNEREKSIYEQLVEEKRQRARFYEQAHLLVSKTVVQKVQREGLGASFQDLNAAANALSKSQEALLGKHPDNVVNVGVEAKLTQKLTQNLTEKLTLQEFQRHARELLDSV